MDLMLRPTRFVHFRISLLNSCNFILIHFDKLNFWGTYQKAIRELLPVLNLFDPPCSVSDEEFFTSVVPSGHCIAFLGELGAAEEEEVVAGGNF